MQEDIDNAKIDKTKILYGINLKYTDSNDELKENIK